MVTKQLDFFRDIPLRVVIEPCCSTERAASLLKVSPSTLSRAQREGKIPYCRDSWEVDFLNQRQGNSYLWQVRFLVNS